MPLTGQAEAAAAAAKAEAVRLDCVRKSEVLSTRRDELLVELGIVSDALEAVYNARLDAQEAYGELMESVVDALGGEAAESLVASIVTASMGRDALAVSQTTSVAAALSETGLGPAPIPSGAEASVFARAGAADVSRRDIACQTEFEKSGKLSSARRARSSDKRERQGSPQMCSSCCQGSISSAATEKDALHPEVARQVFVGGLPKGLVSADEIAQEIESALRDASSVAEGDDGQRLCSHVQMLAGGSYAFATLRSAHLVETALQLPPLPVAHGRACLRLERPRVRCAPADAVASTAISAAPSRSSSGASAQPAQLQARLEADVTGGGGGGGGGAAGSAVRVPAPASLESKLYWALRDAPSPRPNEKEVRESIAFFKQTNKFIRDKKVIFDVCGSHGLLGALFLAYGRTEQVVVLDKFQPASFANVHEALKPFWSPDASLLAGAPRVSSSSIPSGGATRESDESIEQCGDCDVDFAEAVIENASESEIDGEVRGDLMEFVIGDFRQSLPALLSSRGRPEELAVLACHACSYLTDDVIDMCVAQGIDFAVMPCCHRDLKTQGQMKIVAKYLGTSPHTAIDVARVGAGSRLYTYVATRCSRLLGECGSGFVTCYPQITSGGFDCRWRSIPANITPENRILIGLAKHKLTSLAMRAECETNSDRKLSHIYAKIHGFQVDPYKDKTFGPLLAASTAGVLQQPVAVAR